MKIIKREPLGSIPVYDLGISTSVNMHNFILENGMVASNCFNKAHSISYSFLTYISAYLKTHYPLEFFAALMSTRSKTLQPKSWALKAHEYISEAKTFNVDILPPDINRSSFDFTIDNGQIYFGFNAIRDVGKTAAKSIMNTRRSTPFKDIKDFANRVNLQKVNTKTFEALVKAGCFDQLGYSRFELLQKTAELYSYHKNLEEYNTRKIDITSRELHNSKVVPLIERRNFLRKEVKRIANKIEKGKETSEELASYSYNVTELESLEEQNLKKLPPLKEKDLPIFPTFERNKILKLSLPQVLDQAHYIGCYIGGHPISMLNISKTDIVSLEEDEKDVKVAGVVVTCRQIITRSGRKMAFLEIDDSTATAEIVLFPQLFQKYEGLEISEGDILTLTVKVESISPDIKLIPSKINKYRIENEVDS